MNYSEKLKDPRWQKKRLEILERDGWKCMACGSKEETLHVHHICYFPKKEPWDIWSGFLITLCKDCHKSNPCSGKDCENCRETGFNDGTCDGPGDVPEELLGCIAALLNEIWKSDNIGDFWSSIGYITANLPGGKSE